MPHLIGFPRVDLTDVDAQLLCRLMCEEGRDRLLERSLATIDARPAWFTSRENPIEWQHARPAAYLLLRAQDLPWQRPGVTLILIKDFAIDDRIVDTIGGNH